MAFSRKLFDLVREKMPRRLHGMLFSYYPPFLGAGIEVLEISVDARRVRVRLNARPWTGNIHGTQFGGSIYAMTDPFYAYMLQVNLGPDFVCWDKAAQVRFRKPGKGPLQAEFELTPERIAEVESRLALHGRADVDFLVAVTDSMGVIVAEISKTVTVKHK
jgi:hypothetical protein